MWYRFLLSFTKSRYGEITTMEEKKIETYTCIYCQNEFLNQRWAKAFCHHCKRELNVCLECAMYTDWCPECGAPLEAQ